jgi:hypothetical protein
VLSLAPLVLLENAGTLEILFRSELLVELGLLAPLEPWVQTDCLSWLRWDWVQSELSVQLAQLELFDWNSWGCGFSRNCWF